MTQTAHPLALTRPRGALISVLLVTVVWGVIGFGVLAPDMPTYGDFGVKFVEAQTLLRTGFRSMTLLYPGAAVDPRWEFFPFVPPFILELPSGIQGIYPPFTSIIQALCIGVAGIPGVVALSLLSASLILWFTVRLVPLSSAWAFPVVLALGTCLWFYATLPWEHAPAVAFDMAALYVASRPRRYGPWVAGVLLGVGTGLRSESMLLLPGVLLTLWLSSRRPTALVATVVAFGSLVLSINLMDSVLYGRPIAAHILHAVGFVRRAAGAGGESVQDVRGLETLTFAQRYDIVVHYWLVGGLDRLALALIVAALASAAALARWSRHWVVVPAVVLVVLGWSLVNVAGEISRMRWLNGLFTLSPFLVFALLPAPGLSDDARRFRRTMIVSSVIYVGVALLTTDTTGGKGFGPRHLLQLVPLLSLSAWQAIMAYAESGRTRLAHRAIAWTGFGLVATSVALSFAFALPPYVRQNRADRRAMDALLSAPQRIVVASDQATAQLMAPIYFKKSVLLAARDWQAKDLGTAIAAAGLPSFVVIRRGPRPDLEYPPFHLEASLEFENLSVDRWAR